MCSLKVRGTQILPAFCSSSAIIIATCEASSNCFLAMYRRNTYLKSYNKKEHVMLIVVNLK